MKPVLLALSPHLDDAAFSAGAALAERARAGWRVIIATVFTGSVARPSGFALACQLDKGLTADVDYMALRRREDAEACAILGAEPLHLPLQEAPHRGYESAAALFAGVHANDKALTDLPDTLTALLQDINAREIWAPRAVGGHVDHRLVHRAVWSQEGRPPVRWWTDYPYAARAAAADPESATVAGAVWKKEPLTGFGRDTKIDACAAYRSQLQFQFGGAATMVSCFRAQAYELFAS